MIAGGRESVVRQGDELVRLPTVVADLDQRIGVGLDDRADGAAGQRPELGNSSTTSRTACRVGGISVRLSQGFMGMSTHVVMSRGGASPAMSHAVTTGKVAPSRPLIDTTTSYVTPNGAIRVDRTGASGSAARIWSCR